MAVAFVGSVLAWPGETSDDPRDFPPPTRLHCGGAAAGVPGRALGAALSVAAAVDPKVADVVSFSVVRADDPERWAFLHYSVAVAGDGDGVARVELTGLELGAEYLLMARAHERGQELGYYKMWSRVAHYDGVCTAAAAPIAEAPDRPAGKPATRWVEAYRRNGPTDFNPSAAADPSNNYTLPDYLENHNAFGMAPTDPGTFFGAGAEKYTNASFARYCVELEVVSFSNVTTPGYVLGHTGPVRNVTSGYADYLSCNSGKCAPMMCGDRCIYLSHEVMKQECPMTATQERWVDAHFNPNATSVPEKQEQECFYKEFWLPPRGCQGRNLAVSLRYVGFADQMLSFPIGGQCSVGAAVGDGGCTWREAPASHTVSQGRLMAKGAFDPTKSYAERTLAVDAAFAEAGARPCGSAPVAVLV